MAVHKGIRTYTSEEIANLALGQAGFDIVGASGAGATENVPAGVDYWIAFKIVGGDAGVKATCHSSFPGDSHFSTTGASGGTAITCNDGDIVYGAFTSITTSAAGDYVIAYRG